MENRTREIILSRLENSKNSSFASLFPDDRGAQARLRRSVDVGCTLGGKCAGTMRFEFTGSGAQLFWLYVSPELRRHGCGGALLECFTALARQDGRRPLGVIYEQNLPDTRLLDLMLLRRGFELSTYSTACCAVTARQMRTLPFVNRGAPYVGALKGGVLLQLSSLSRPLRSTLIRGKYSPVERLLGSGECDEALSQLWLKQGSIEAALLCSRNGKDVHVEFVYSSGLAPEVIRRMLLSLTAVWLSDAPDDSVLRFHTSNQKIEDFVKRTIPLLQTETVWRRQAVLYWPRGGVQRG